MGYTPYECHYNPGIALSASHRPGLGNNPYSGVYAPPMGISAYRMTQGPPTHGIWNTEHYHYTVLLGQISRMIEFKVGKSIQAPAGIKQPKLSELPKYSRSHSHNEFLDWLHAFLNWLRGHYICGPDTDSTQVIYLGMYVEGPASNWFVSGQSFTRDRATHIHQLYMHHA